MFIYGYIFLGKNNGLSVFFSDGEYIGQIVVVKDVRFVRMIKCWIDFIISIYMINILYYFLNNDVYSGKLI